MAVVFAGPSPLRQAAFSPRIGEMPDSLPEPPLSFEAYAYLGRSTELGDALKKVSIEDLNRVDADRDTPLMRIVRKISALSTITFGHVQAVELLIRAGASPLPVNAKGQNLWHVALKESRLTAGNHESLKAILRLFFNAYLDINLADQEGRTPLSLRAPSESNRVHSADYDIDLVLFLLRKGALPHEPNAHGVTAFYHFSVLSDCFSPILLRAILEQVPMDRRRQADFMAFALKNLPYWQLYRLEEFYRCQDGFSLPGLLQTRGNLFPNDSEGKSVMRKLILNEKVSADDVAASLALSDFDQVEQVAEAFFELFAPANCKDDFLESSSLVKKEEVPASAFTFDLKAFCKKIQDSPSKDQWLKLMINRGLKPASVSNGKGSRISKSSSSGSRRSSLKGSKRSSGTDQV